MEEEYNENQDSLKQSFSSLLDDLDSGTQLNYFRAEDLFRRITSHSELAEGHIANSLALKNKEKNKFNLLKNKKSVQTSIREDKVAPLELLNHLITIISYMDEINSWERLKNEALQRYVDQLYKVHMTTKSFEIEKEVSKGFEERQKAWMELTKNLIENKFENLNNRILGLTKGLEMLKSANEGKYFALNERILKIQNQTLKFIAHIPVSKEEREMTEINTCEYCGLSFMSKKELRDHEKVCEDILIEVEKPNQSLQKFDDVDDIENEIDEESQKIDDEIDEQLKDLEGDEDDNR